MKAQNIKDTANKGKMTLKKLNRRFFTDNVLYAAAFIVYFLVAFYIVQKRIRANVPSLTYLDIIFYPFRGLYSFLMGFLNSTVITDQVSENIQERLMENTETFSTLENIINDNAVENDIHLEL